MATRATGSMAQRLESWSGEKTGSSNRKRSFWSMNVHKHMYRVYDSWEGPEAMVWQGDLRELLGEGSEMSEVDSERIRALKPGQSYEYGNGLRVERVGFRVVPAGDPG